MSNGFSFGENNSSFEYDNKLGQLLSLIGELISLQRETLEEVRGFRTDLKDIMVTWRDRSNDNWQ